MDRLERTFLEKDIRQRELDELTHRLSLDPSNLALTQEMKIVKDFIELVLDWHIKKGGGGYLWRQEFDPPQLPYGSE